MKPIRWIAAFDTHGDMIDQSAREAFVKFQKFWKPTRVIHGGDWCDLRALRSSASAQDKADGIEEDIEQGIDFLLEIGVTDLLFGNHDNRLIKALKYKPDGIIRAAASKLYDDVVRALDPKRVKYVPYGKRFGVLQLGKRTRIVHGYNASVYSAKQVATAFAMPGGTAMMGHVHTSSEHQEPCLDGRHGMTIGCLCNLDMEYTEGHVKTLGWVHSWAYGLEYPNGEVVTWRAIKLPDGKWVLPSEIKTI